MGIIDYNVLSLLDKLFAAGKLDCACDRLPFKQIKNYKSKTNRNLCKLPPL